MISTSKNMYINKLHNIVNKYKNKYHNTIKMKPVDINSSAYIDFDKKNNKAKFKADDNVRISKYKNIFEKDYVSNWSDEVFVIKKIVPWTYVIMILTEKKSLERFAKKNSKKQNQKEFRIKKVIKRKGDKLYVQWKGYDSSFNSWIDKKYIVI